MPTIAIATLACMAGAFLICGIPSGLIIARHSSEHVDVRKVGSGNIGMTNVARSAGGGAAALTLLCDAGKGYLAIMLGRLVVSQVAFGGDFSQTAALGAIRLVRSPACRIVWMSGALELHSFLDMEPSIRMLERSQAEAVVFLGKVGVGLSAERLLAGAFAPYDRAFLVLDDEDVFDGDVTTLPETTCAAVCFRGSHPEAPAQYARTSRARSR